jgi:hypothetical protein
VPTGHGVMCWLTSSWTCFARPLVAILCLSGSHNEFVRCIMPPIPSQLLHSATQSQGGLFEAVTAQLIPPLRICWLGQGYQDPGTDSGP